MKTSITPILVALAAGLMLAGCATTPPAPRVAYPITYQIPLNSTQVSGDTGPQALEVNATQSVATIPSATLYYRIDSPIEVVVTIYEHSSQGYRDMVGQMKGTQITNTITPETRELQFSFAPSRPNTSGTLQFTLSDRPIAAGVTTAP